MSKFGTELIEAMQDALAHAQAQAQVQAKSEPTGLVVHNVDVETVDAKAVRSKLKLTQQQMALMLGTSVSGYRKWEQGRRQPGGAARTLLRVMDQEPQAVLRALA